MNTANQKNGLAHQCHSLVLRAVRHTIQQGVIDINTERCKGCGLCVATCPAQTLQLSALVNKRGYHYSTQIAEAHCIGCASCALICPDACISVYRTSLTHRTSI